MSLSAMAAVQTNPQCASYLRLFRSELATCETPAVAHYTLDHWNGVLRGLYMAGAISQESRDRMNEAMDDLASERAAQLAKRITEQLHAQD